MANNQKANKLLHEMRLGILADLIIEGYSRRQIFQHIAKPKNEPLFQLSDRQIDNLIKQAGNYIKAESNVDLETEVKKAKRRYERIIYEAMAGKKKDLSVAIAAQKELDRLLGTSAPKRIDIGPQKIIVGIKPKENN